MKLPFKLFTRGESLGPPPPPFQVGDDTQPQQPQRNQKWVILIGLALLLVVAGGGAKELYTDWLWFESVTYTSVFLTILTSRIGLFAVGALAFFIFVIINVFIANLLAPRPDMPGLSAEERRLANRMITIVTLGIALFLSFVFGSLLSNEWRPILAFMYAVPFGSTDPIFNQDVGFYVFSMPVFRFLQTLGLGAIAATMVGSLAVYGLSMAFRGSLPRPRIVRAHISILGMGILLLIAGGYWLDRYDLMLSAEGIVFGPGYTDMNARLPAYTVLAGLAALSALLLGINIFLRGIRVPLVAVGLWVMVAAIGGNAYPEFVQRIQVEPNELARERPYLENNILFTRSAFGLDRIEEVDYPGEDQPTTQDILDNPQTIQNIRLWDHEPLKATYDQIQSIRRYYEFYDVDIDRYNLGGDYRQVMISARELSPERISLEGEAVTWVNQRLKFTHGYGITLSPVNEILGEGLPNLYVKNLPPVSSPPIPELNITQPEIYFGELTLDWVIVNTDEEEVDYASETEIKYARYAGSGGVVLDSIFKRVIFAWQMTDPNILLTGLREDSQILFYRTVQERVNHITPFLMLDGDPYIVIDGGKLLYVQDAYTTSDRYPYSELFNDDFNYIRNSVKAVVDAYEGTVQYYISDPSDPIIQTYSRIFPGLFKPLEEMSADLRFHVRYPEDFFNVQADMYQIYHMQDPQVFYNKEDAYARPLELYLDSEKPMDAYYVIMRLAGESTSEFMLILPFTPVNKNNTNAWLAGRSDGENYGKLLAFTFPKERLIFGPRQVESRIDQDAAISAQFALWNQSGSRVLRGNLLFVPIADSYLYVEPIYLQSAQSQLPELKRVIVAAGSRIAMEENLDLSLVEIFGAEVLGPDGGGTRPPAVTQPQTPSTTQPTTTTPTTQTSAQEIANLARQADEIYTRALEQQRSGDWTAYGESLKELEAILKQMVELAQ